MENWLLWIPPIVSVAAAVTVIVIAYAVRQQAGARVSRYRGEYDAVSIERDNLTNFIVHDHDERAQITERNRRSPEGASGTSLNVNARSGMGDVTVFVDRGTPAIVTITDAATRATTRYYLANGVDPYLVVRERPVKGADAPYVDRWYFEAGEYITYRDTDPTLQEKTIQYSYPPVGSDDIQRLKSQLKAALAPRSSAPARGSA
jgi:hypothetical protein